MKVFKITQMCKPKDVENWLTVKHIEDCVRGNCTITPRVELKIEDITDEEESIDTTVVFNRLLKKVHKETDADFCVAWSKALENFCNATMIQVGG